MIAARLDALSADEKRLLQDAAVVGNVFWLGAVEAIDGFQALPAEEARTWPQEISEQAAPRTDTRPVVARCLSARRPEVHAVRPRGSRRGLSRRPRG